MIYKNTTFNQSNAYIGSQVATPYSVLTWLLWLRLWVMSACGIRHAMPRRVMPRQTQDLNRARRHSQAYFARCALPPARNLAALRALGPRGLSPTQSLERLAKISVLGRVRLYNISWVGSVLLRRALLICYDHGWWRAPMLRLRGGLNPKFLCPP